MNQTLLVEAPLWDRPRLDIAATQGCQGKQASTSGVAAEADPKARAHIKRSGSIPQICAAKPPSWGRLGTHVVGHRGRPPQPGAFDGASQADQPFSAREASAGHLSPAGSLPWVGGPCWMRARQSRQPRCQGKRWAHRTPKGASRLPRHQRGRATRADISPTGSQRLAHRRGPIAASPAAMGHRGYPGMPRQAGQYFWLRRRRSQ